MPSSQKSLLPTILIVIALIFWGANILFAAAAPELSSKVGDALNIVNTLFSSASLAFALFLLLSQREDTRSASSENKRASELQALTSLLNLHTTRESDFIALAESLELRKSKFHRELVYEKPEDARKKAVQQRIEELSKRIKQCNKKRQESSLAINLIGEKLIKLSECELSGDLVIPKPINFGL